MVQKNMENWLSYIQFLTYEKNEYENYIGRLILSNPCNQNMIGFKNFRRIIEIKKQDKAIIF